jgi:hypothetical protein
LPSRELDPSGEWERRVQPGGRPAEMNPPRLAFEEIGACEDMKLTAVLTREFDGLNSINSIDCGGAMTAVVVAGIASCPAPLNATDAIKSR